MWSLLADDNDDVYQAKQNLFRGAEIVDRGRNVADCILPEIGTKEVTPNGSWLEAKQIQTALEARNALVSAERIDKL